MTRRLSDQGTVTVQSIYSYEDVVKVALPELSPAFDHYPCVIPNWDNTPRSGNNGLVFQNATPELFKQHLAGGR